jgi:hypothetical protein
LPGEKGYNDFGQIWKVWVPNDYVANTITNAATLLQTGYKTEKTDKLLNMAVVRDKSHARIRFNRKSRTATRLVSGRSRKILPF